MSEKLTTSYRQRYGDTSAMLADLNLQEAMKTWLYEANFKFPTYHVIVLESKKDIVWHNCFPVTSITSFNEGVERSISLEWVTDMKCGENEFSFCIFLEGTVRLENTKTLEE